MFNNTSIFENKNVVVSSKTSSSETDENVVEKRGKQMGIYQQRVDNTDKNTALKNQVLNIDQLLEKEKLHNKTESWNKLDKTEKIQKLHTFAEKYGKDNAMALKDIKSLKYFFKECLEKNKLQKTKDVYYDKDTREIQSIPSLYFNQLNRNFTLKIIDAKRVSTLKSLTPKRPKEVLCNEETDTKETDTNKQN
jgi:hypothetical protein